MADRLKVGRAWRVRLGAIALLPVLVAPAACKPAAFARQEAELFYEPPPVLTEANGFWNDPARGAFGETSFAPGLYQRAGQPCRPARQTVIDNAARTTSDRTLLYCQSPDGRWTWQPSVTCRPVATGPGLSCRDADGTSVALSPA